MNAFIATESTPPRSHDTGARAPSARADRIAVIVNPATHGDAERIIAALGHQAPDGIELAVHRTPAAGTAAQVARAALADGADFAVAVGGDGTVAEVAGALDGTDIPLGIIPGGSTNITARSLGIPGGPEEAIRVLFAPHRTVPLDLGYAAGRPFLHMAGAGLDSRLFADADPALKRRIGWLAYLPPAVRDLEVPPTRFTIVADGIMTKVTAPLVLVCNGSAIISPRLSLYPGIDPEDGQLDVLIFTPTGPVELARTLARLATEGLEHSPFVSHVRAHRVAIAADPALPVELDGDVVARTPLAVTLAPAAVRVIVPLHGEEG